MQCLLWASPALPHLRSLPHCECLSWGGCRGPWGLSAQVTFRPAPTQSTGQERTPSQGRTWERGSLLCFWPWLLIGGNIPGPGTSQGPRLQSPFYEALTRRQMGFCVSPTLSVLAAPARAAAGPPERWVSGELRVAWAPGRPDKVFLMRCRQGSQQRREQPLTSAGGSFQVTSSLAPPPWEGAW